MRPGETTRYTGYLCRRDIHEFLFAETPVDEAAPPRSSAAAAQRLGCVAVTVFATRRVRVEDSSSDDEQGHSSSGAITATRLPEKQAVKEYGVQARAGGPVERVPRYRRRRRGEWRLEKVKPAVATVRTSLYPPVSRWLSISPFTVLWRSQVRVRYRDEMWWSRHGLLEAEPRRSRDAAATTAATATTATTAAAAATAAAAGGSVRLKVEGEGGAAAAAVAAPIVKTERRPGEAPRAPGKPWS